MASKSNNLAFFGATGGCAGSCLAAALTAGYKCTALARAPSKLEEALINRGVNQSLISSNLTIVPGDVRDIEAVKAVVTGVDVIVSGVGAYPRWQMSLWKPLAMTDRMICADASTTILNAAQSLNAHASGRKPFFIVISTAGVQERGKPRALPLAYLPWYGWLLADPLADKVAMEDIVLGHMKLSESQRGIDGYVMLKPSLLTNGKGKGIDAVRVGKSDAPPVGYSIDREALGQWAFQHLVIEDGGRGKWKDARVTITY